MSLAIGVCLVLPSNASVADPFRAPECERCAGNRGVEFAVPIGSDVMAGLSGTVSFVGVVAGRNYVVLRATANPAVRVTYGGLALLTTPQLRHGSVVARGERIGVAQHLLHIGLRIGDQYVDPQQVGHSEYSQVAKPRYRVTLGARRTRSCSR